METFRALVEHAPDGVVVSRNGLVLYANIAAATLLGFSSANEMMGIGMHAFLDEASLASMRRRIELLARGRQLLPKEYVAKRRDGSSVVAEIGSTIIEWEGAPAVVAFVRDVTERSRLRSQLAHAERLAAVSVMAAGVAHEINNPLAFMTLATDMIARRIANVPNLDDVRTLIGDLRGGVRKIAGIVRDLRTFGSFDNEPSTKVDLSASLDYAERMVMHEIRPRVRLTRETGEIPPVVGVSKRLEQVFVNVFLHAANAIAEDRQDGEIIVRARERDVVVEIEDNGTGIAADALPHIFEPFAASKHGLSGSGLGLSMCRDAVQSFGGDISATSEPGRGTVLHLTLVRADIDSVPPPPQKEPLLAESGAS